MGSPGNEASDEPFQASDRPRMADLPENPRQFPLSAGILFGLGLGGFFDGIVLHQVLQWHHMLTSAGYPPDSLENLEINTFFDGLFLTAFFAGGVKLQGWQQTLDRYRKKYQGEGKEMGKLAFSDIATEVLSPDRALVTGRWQLTLGKDTPGGLFTLILKKLPEGWRITHDHTSQ